MDLKQCRVLVTPTSFGRNDPGLKSELEEKVGQVIYNPFPRPLASAELTRLLPGCDGYIAGVDVIDQDALAAADRLKVIARYGVGIDNIALQATREKGIVVTNTPQANCVAVAELTLGLVLALARHIPQSVAATRGGQWPRQLGISLEGKTVGLVGLGAVGKQVARRLVGFDCQILSYDLFPDLHFAEEHHVQCVALDDLIRQSDVISLHLPLSPETRGMVNAAFLAKMRQGSFLINTSRGELVDEEALADAIESAHLSGAALDVFCHEPPDRASRLLHLSNVLVTPHSGAHTDGAMSAMGRGALHDCLAVLEGKEPLHRVNLETILAG